MSGEGSPVCLICNASMGVSSRNNCPIFQTNVTTTDQPVSNILSVILGQEIQKEVIHSEAICKKCFKLCNEVDELQERITEIKMELNGFYQKTLRQIGDSPEEDEPASKSLYAASNKDKDTVTLIKKAPIKRVRKSTPENGAPTEAQKNVKSDKDDESRDNEGGEDDDSDYSPLSLKKLDDGQESLNKDEILKKMKVELEEEDDDEDEEDDDDADENAEEQAVFSKKKIPKPKVADDFNHIIPQMIISREGKIYTCLLCSAEEKVQGESKVIISHMKTMHNIKLFICDLCGVEFLKRNELLEHVNEHTGNEDGEYECEVCHRVFTNLRLYRVHKRMHFPQQKNHVCDSCGKAFLSRNMLEEHMNTHTGARPYKCNECAKDFASKYSLRAHEKTHLDKARPYKCTHCTKTFVTEASVAQHEKTHNAPRNFACNTCGKSFSSSRNLEVHCVIHTGFKPFVCRICNKAFARKAEIRDHERTHTGEKPYQCEFCGATFGQRSNLQSHKRATHYDDKRYQCIECGKAFKRRRLLDYHIKAAHTGERPYKCQLCSATFIYPEHFKKHRRIHTGEKPYACEVCGKAFNSRDNRNAHRFVHSDKKPYECLVCGLGFMRKPQLYNHMQSQGHINDTIVVNQPRLTTDDDLIAQEEQESRMEMVVEPQEQVLEEDAEGGDTKMYIRELKEHVIIQTKSEEEMGGENQYGEEVEHLIIDGQVQFADGEALEIDGTTAIAGVEGQHSLVIPASRHGGEYTVEGAEGNATVQTADGTLQLVISLPGDSDSNQQPWFNIVQQE